MPDGDVVRLRTACGGSIIAAFIPYKPDFMPKPAKPAQPSSYSLVASPFPDSIAASSRSDSDSSSRPTILMSHGTAVDLGRLLPFYRSAACSVLCCTRRDVKSAGGNKCLRTVFVAMHGGLLTLHASWPTAARSQRTSNATCAPTTTRATGTAVGGRQWQTPWLTLMRSSSGCCGVACGGSG